MVLQESTSLRRFFLFEYWILHHFSNCVVGTLCTKKCQDIPCFLPDPSFCWSNNKLEAFSTSRPTGCILEVLLGITWKTWKKQYIFLKGAAGAVLFQAPSPQKKKVFILLGPLAKGRIHGKILRSDHHGGCNFLGFIRADMDHRLRFLVAIDVRLVYGPERFPQWPVFHFAHGSRGLDLSNSFLLFLNGTSKAQCILRTCF